MDNNEVAPMNMKKCKTCNKEISKNALSCPNCGDTEPFKSNKYFMIIGLTAVFFGIILMFYFRIV